MKVCCLKYLMCESIPAGWAGVKHASPKAVPREAISEGVVWRTREEDALAQFAGEIARK
jgi:hypothetical protein